MQGQELPDYKRKFLSEMEQLKQEQEEAERPVNKALRDEPKKQFKPSQNNILNTSQYSSSEWRQQLNQTSFQANHDQSHFEMNLLMNPEVSRKQNNIRSTQISEYSNAKHNNTVFVNPKNTSC